MARRVIRHLNAKQLSEGYPVDEPNSSWTLKIGLLCEHLCRLLAHMDANGYDTARPELDDPDMETRPFMDFAAGYVQRAVNQLPRQGAGQPWQTSMSYHADVKLLRNDSVVDPHLKLTASAGTAAKRAQVVMA